MLTIRLLIIFASSSIWKSKSSGICKSPSSAQISKIASVSAKEPFEILRKLIKSFAVLRFFPSAILALRYFVWVIFVSNIDKLYSYTSILEPKTVG